MKKLIAILFFFAFQASFAQELRCRVNVQFAEVANADKELFAAMQKDIEEFINSTIWTSNSFEENEKIEMRLNFRITKQVSTKNFLADVQIQSSRPVFNSTYTTQMFNRLDEGVNIEYEEGSAIEVSDNSFISNLSSLLTFYAYIVIGIDFDSFSPQGGTQYFQKAQQVAIAAAPNNEKEWSSSASNKENKYWLVENILNSSYSGYRSALYSYHRLGLDVMESKVTDGRKFIIQALEDIEKIYKIKPGAFIITVFFYAKKDEIIDIFSQALPDEKARVVELCKKMNPANASEYDKILQEK